MRHWVQRPERRLAALQLGKVSRDANLLGSACTALAWWGHACLPPGPDSSLNEALPWGAFPTQVHLGPESCRGGWASQQDGLELLE